MIGSTLMIHQAKSKWGKENKMKREGAMNWVECVVLLLMAVLLVALFVPGRIMAQAKVLELTYGSPYGPDHTFSRTDKKWMAKIEKETNGQVKFKPFWGGAIIGPSGDAIDEVIKGVADVGFISPGQSRTGYDIAKANFLFFSGASLDAGYRIFMEVLKKYPVIEEEYKNLKVMGWSSGLEYNLLTRKPARKLSDIKGMRLKTLGEIVTVLRDLGVEGMASPMSEVYVSMQKGILDGGFVTYSTLKTMRFAEVAKYMTLLHLYRPHTGSRVMGLTAWNKLSPDVQKIFQNNVGWFSVVADKDVDQDEQEGVDFGKKNGVEFINLPKEDMAKFYGLVQEEAVKVAKSIDGKGLPGTAILNEAQRLIKASGK
jgi:TRAP-type C4-dicarboxylate transport system substrate-binding protein